MKPTNSVYVGGPPLDPSEDDEDYIELDEPQGDYDAPSEELEDF